MTLKIEQAMRQGTVAFTLTGRIEAEHVAELKELLALHRDAKIIVLDLKEIRLADRDAMKFLARCQSEGIQLKNCPSYIREWIKTEND